MIDILTSVCNKIWKTGKWPTTWTQFLVITLPKKGKLQLCQNYRTSGWLGLAMMLGSFHCRGVLLLWHIVGQGPAVLAAGAGRVGYVLFIFLVSSILSSLSNASSVGRRLAILKYCGLGRSNPAVVVSYYRRRAR